MFDRGYYARGGRIDPVNTQGKNPVLRGGSYILPSKYARMSSRDTVKPTGRSNSYGAMRPVFNPR